MQPGTRSTDVVEKFPPEKGRGIGYVSLGLAGLVIADVLLQWRTWQGLAVAAVAVAAGLVVWLGLIRPSVVAYPDRVVLRNFLRDVHLPWETVTDVFGRRALTIEAQGREYSSVAITTSGLDRRTLRRRLGVSPLSNPLQGKPEKRTDPLPGETATEARERVRHGTDQLTPLEYARQRLRELCRHYTGGPEASPGTDTSVVPGDSANQARDHSAHAPVADHGREQPRVHQEWLVVPLGALMAAIAVALVAGLSG